MFCMRMGGECLYVYILRVFKRSLRMNVLSMQVYYQILKPYECMCECVFHNLFPWSSGTEANMGTREMSQLPLCKSLRTQESSIVKGTVLTTSVYTV